MLGTWMVIGTFFFVAGGMIGFTMAALFAGRRLHEARATIGRLREKVRRLEG